MRRLVVLVRALGLTLMITLSPLTPGAASTLGPSFTWSATCTEIASGGFVPAANVRAMVPAEFRMVGEETGRVVLNVGMSTCQGMVIDGQPVPDALSGFVAVFIHAPEGAGVDRYYLWANGTSRELDRRLWMLDMPSIVSRRMTFAMAGDGPVITASSVMPRVGESQGGYRASVTTSALAPASVTAPGPPYWHVGRRGLVNARFAVTTLEESVGPAVIEAQPGTEMSELIGGQRLDGGALLIRFRFDATIGPAG